MRKELLNAIFVVEGKTDSERLHKLGVPYIVRTQGSIVSRGTINHLVELSNIHTIVALTDPDGPGQRINEKLKSYIPNLIVLSVDKESTIKKSKIGIAHLELSKLESLIKPYLSKKFTSSSDVLYRDLLRLELTGPHSRHKRELIIKKFNLLGTSLKTMYTQILLLNISLKALEETINE